MKVKGTSVVFGNRFENEFDTLSKSIDNVFEYIKYTPDVFTFNEKLNALRSIVEESCICILLDTDHLVVDNLEISLNCTIEQGIHTRVSFQEYSTHRWQKINQDINTNGYFDVLKEEVGKYWTGFLDESFLVFNIPNLNLFNSFLDDWQKLVKLTENNSPYRYSDQNLGALEGCLINIAANKNKIPIHSGKIPSVFSSFYHYGPSHGHKTKINESII